MASSRADRQPEIPPDYDYDLLAKRFGIRRRSFGWSIDELAKRSGISRHTIMRLEKGLPARYSSIRRVRAKLQFFSEQLTKNFQASQHFAVHRAEKNRWLVGRSRDRRGRDITHTDFLYVDDLAERARQAELGFQPFFTCMLRSELPDGVLGQAIMELYAPTPFDRHFGEEFVYCLEGTLEMTVEDETCTLVAGDSMVFDATSAHRYAPVAGTVTPARILVVVGMRPNEAEKVKRLDNPPRNWGV
ncbi:helix-turn-helix domain-containing protein [Fimbriimonas ginsengisoli]|uniref:XRE family transcriptional regulator n=1 Tax=Fimbriimonas ginsengisoli Gsoil 348 TaxID=661478 RepID=A0A068NJR4_FIMGI|nr:XRE family transcriptional regulator [Fimbriimonas ginsengisoli]AIE83746.1 XRE family transcriptional regulator [Fimbriimonas ginsengisoli Gsoil 348]